MNLIVKKLDANDVNLFVQLIRLFADVFETSKVNLPHRDHLLQVLNLNSFVAFVALLDNNVVGGLTAHMLPQYYSAAPLMYVYDLAVSTQYQRQGIGKQLMANLKDYGRQVGVEEVFVQADEDDDQATDFYRSTGGTPANVIHFTYPLAD